MKKIAFLSLLLIILISCKNNQNTAEESTKTKDGPESFVVLEHMEAAGYVYILGDQGGAKRWFALTSRQVIEGEVFYYEDPLIMKDYFSKELERPFDEVLFLSRVSKNPQDLAPPSIDNTMSAKKSIGKITTEQHKINIDLPENAISIGELYEQMETFNSQKVKVRGKVVKFSPEIMQTNWIHIQDGTSFQDKFDLTITSNEIVKEGDIITFEGIVSVNKDFGYGYFYELILEQAETIK
ncbi:MAG: hypothetical protein PF484_09775 [Bacteroidales bacterium]|jgi:hypothetical protein|nr:hypothetical protein [Bacteroidales bacterium]